MSEQTPPADFPEKRRPRLLPVDGFVGPAKRTLEAHANEVVGILHHAINALIGVAEDAKTAGSLGVQVDALDRAGRLGLRYVELTTGRRMNLDVRVRSQEDLYDTRAIYLSLPPEQRAALDNALDAVEAFRASRVIDVKALQERP